MNPILYGIMLEIERHGFPAVDLDGKNGVITVLGRLGRRYLVSLPAGSHIRLTESATRNEHDFDLCDPECWNSITKRLGT